jgi:hypothetical protein
LVEACLSATPVVAYDVEWQSELITPGETGMLVPYRDVKGMAAAVCQLIREPELAASLGRQARDLTIETMDRQTLIAREQADYERLLDRSPPMAPAERPPAQEAAHIVADRPGDVADPAWPTSEQATDHSWMPG